MEIKQAICYPMFRDRMSLDAFMEAAERIGYAAVDLWRRDGQFAEIVAAAKARHLAIASCVGHDDANHGLNQRENHARIEQELAQSIDVAAQHHIPGLICFSGARREGLTDRQGAETAAAGLRRIAPYAEKKGINLVLEVLNSKIDHPGYQADHMAWAVDVCRWVNSPRVKILCDIYHMQIMEGDLIRTIRTYAAFIGHYHTAGNPGRHDLDGDQEINYPAVCRAIAATGYDGYVGHEFSPVGDPVTAMENAFKICKE